eukprot:6177305-Pyramimonas_sp.AAC.1
MSAHLPQDLQESVERELTDFLTSTGLGKDLGVGTATLRRLLNPQPATEWVLSGDKRHLGLALDLAGRGFEPLRAEAFYSALQVNMGSTSHQTGVEFLRNFG